MAKEGSEFEPPQSSWGQVASYSGHGLTMVGAICLFMAVGWWADGKLGWSPVLTIAGAFVGGSAGFYSMWRHLVDDTPDRTSHKP